MKTNVNITRKMDNFDVYQRTKDSMFNATSLLKQWNEYSGQQKDISHYFENKSTDEFIEALLKDENSNSRNSVVLKSAGRYGGTWMHPYLFIDFAMWLNPSFKLHVIKFVYDELIQHRKLSGDYYNKLCSLLSQFPETDFSIIGKTLNYVVFNTHKKEIRNEATPEQQNDLQQVTRDMCRDIERGHIRSFTSFIRCMREEWRVRHSQVPKVFDQHTA